MTEPKGMSVAQTFEWLRERSQRLVATEERLARLEAALRYYADATHRDNGQRARAALEETP